MSELTSIIMCALNQGDWVRQTVPRAMEAMGVSQHEVIVIDDQSVDGCCNGLPGETRIYRTETRHGVSGGRRFATTFAKGDVLVFSDPHCHYPENALEHIADLARRTPAIIVPKTTSHPSKQVRYGGKLVISERGLRVERCTKGTYRWPALVGAIYAVRRDVYDFLDGWPHLPGVWGYSEQALSLMAWVAGVPIIVDEKFTCNHENYHPTDDKGNQRFNYHVKLVDQARNGAHIHGAFFPETYKTFWRPMLLQRFGRAGKFEDTFKTDRFKAFRDHVAAKRFRSERDFFHMVLDHPYPDSRKKTNSPGSTRNYIVNPKTPEEYIEQQEPRAQASEYRSTRDRLRRSIRRFFQHTGLIPADVSVIDLGTRDGFALDYLKKLGVGDRKGYELVPRAVDYASGERQRPVHQGDIRDLPDESPDSWDAALCVHVLEHVPEPERAVAEMCRIVKPGGHLLFVVPKEGKPAVKYAHNVCWDELADFARFVCDQPGVEDAPIHAEVLSLHRNNKELAVIAKVK